MRDDFGPLWGLAFALGLGVGLGLCLGLGLDRAAADMPPPPGETERAHQRLIESKGYACPKVVELVYLQGGEGDSLTAKGLEPYNVQCSNGKHFLAAFARRQPGGPRPDRPPPPEPVVKPLD